MAWRVKLNSLALIVALLSFTVPTPVFAQIPDAQAACAYCHARMPGAHRPGCPYYAAPSPPSSRTPAGPTQGVGGSGSLQQNLNQAAFDFGASFGQWLVTPSGPSQAETEAQRQQEEAARQEAIRQERIRQNQLRLERMKQALNMRNAWDNRDAQMTDQLSGVFDVVRPKGTAFFGDPGLTDPGAFDDTSVVDLRDDPPAVPPPPADPSWHDLDELKSVEAQLRGDSWGDASVVDLRDVAESRFSSLTLEEQARRAAATDPYQGVSAPSQRGAWQFQAHQATSAWGTRSGEMAAEYYASVVTDPNAAWYSKGGAYAGGFLASLWTPDTHRYTEATLSAALLAAPAAAALTVTRAAETTATQLEFNFARNFGQDSRLVIGRGDDLKWLRKIRALDEGEYTLGWFERETTRFSMGAEWAVNRAKLQNVMNLNLPIRDASSIMDTGGAYLNNERWMLKAAGWIYRSGYWTPPIP